MRRRCAIYTRKSSEEGLDQSFNSLDAQREACAAFIHSQRQEGWRTLRQSFDDGGFSGGNLQRPGLTALLEAVQSGQVDIIVVYKVDRLTRSLADFARLVEIFDTHQVAFVAVTQQFNTTSSMGRLTLNVLLSFAQFEREVTGERIRDKIAASKRKGLWMGGIVPLGYDVVDRQLVINRAEASIVRRLFALYLETGTVRQLQAAAQTEGLLSKKGRPLQRGALYTLLRNPLYCGRIRHRHQSYPGQHAAIIEPTLWDRVQSQLDKQRIRHREASGHHQPSPLAGRLYLADGRRLTPNHANKGNKRYRYYVATQNSRDEQSGPAIRIPAVELERAVHHGFRQWLVDGAAVARAAGADDTPGLLQQTCAAASKFARSLETTGDRQLCPVITRIAVGEARLVLTVSRRRLREQLKLPTLSEADQFETIPIRWKAKRRGHELRFVLATPESRPPAPDTTLIRAVVRAHDWWHRWQSGEVRSMRDLVDQDNVSKSLLRFHLPLAFLAPDLVEQILAGQQPPDLTTDRLVHSAPLPLDWATQRQLFSR